MRKTIILAAILVVSLLSCRDTREHTIIVRPDTVLEKRDKYTDYVTEKAGREDGTAHTEENPEEKENAPKILYINAPGYIYGRSAPSENSIERRWLGHKRKVYYIRSDGDWILFNLETRFNDEIWLKKEYLVESLDELKPNEELMRQLCGRYNFTRIDLIRGGEEKREDLNALEKQIEKAYIIVSYDGGEKFKYYDHQIPGIVNQDSIYVPNNIQDSFYDVRGDGSGGSFRIQRYFTETGIRVRWTNDSQIIENPEIYEYIYTRSVN
jgi:hypothetical protein